MENWFLEALASLEPVQSHTHSLTHSIKHSLTYSLRVSHICFFKDFKDNSMFFQNPFNVPSKLLQSWLFLCQSSFKVFSKFSQSSFKVLWKIFQSFFRVLAKNAKHTCMFHYIFTWVKINLRNIFYLLGQK